MEDKTLQDVIERLVRIETKLDSYESLREKAEHAKDRAEQAFTLAKSNIELINEIKANNKWAWGFIISLAVGYIGYLLTKI